MNVEIAERLARRRREAGYSQESLAEKLGVSRQAVSKWERSESSPDTDNLIALAQLYSVSIDELLYVDETLRDDVAYEATDRASTQKTGEASVNSTNTQEHGAGNATEHRAKSGNSKRDPEVYIGLSGIHVKDGEDYVHVSWKDGVHVKDSETGDEVHVGLGGIHIEEGAHRNNGDSNFTSTDTTSKAEDWSDAKLYINGKKYDSWHDAEIAFKDTYGIEKTWLKFPFPLVVIIGYILLGVFLNVWAIGLFAFFLIPVYYMIGHTIYSKRFGKFLEGLYPLACIAWFLWMAFVVKQPHPAWVVFLTIPVVEWIVHAISKAYRNRKKAAGV
jgi:HTH-type transcriptional regulator/antitoxin HipB